MVSRMAMGYIGPCKGVAKWPRDTWRFPKIRGSFLGVTRMTIVFWGL